ncbi:hypothetical protein SCUCBS95973_009908 [Sporothrix curviconia]|uniref:Annexin ANXC4 n=1 Tax=Sporothrix curviconia TaxID=1260050 RepID=A0ABP0CYR8_9PEZI
MSSLQVDDSGRRGRSKSPSGRERDRSSSRIERSPSGRDRERDYEREREQRDRERERDRDRDRDEPTIITAAPYPGGDNDDLGDLDDPRKSVRILDYDDYRGSVASPSSRGAPPSSSSGGGGDPKYRSSKYADSDVDIRDVDVRYGDGRREKEYRVEKGDYDYERGSGGGYEREKGRAREKDKSSAAAVTISEDKFAFLPAKYAKKADTGAAAGKAYGSRGGGGGEQPERDSGRGRDSPPKGYYNERTERLQHSSQGPGAWPSEQPSANARPPRRGKGRGSDSDESDNTDDDDDDEGLAYGHGAVPSGKPQGMPAYGHGGDRYATYADEKKYGGGRGAGRDPHIVTAEPRDPLLETRLMAEAPVIPETPETRGTPVILVTLATLETLGTLEILETVAIPGMPEIPATRVTLATPESHTTRETTVDGSNILSVEPSRRRERSRSPMPTKGMERLSVNTLSVGGPQHSGSSLSAAPGSPMQEAYHGTYQSMSPMPSPLMLASHGPGPHGTADVQAMDINGDASDGDVSPTTTRGPGGEVTEKIRRRARFYDPEEDAQRLAKALRGERHPPDTGPLIEILPGLTHDQVMELRTEYKRIVKTGPERKGVNIAKHIRARLKDEDPALMKVCYATALGRWESEAYWANFWYHGDKTRRELLIESLMGRTNDEIRHIKKSFSDKKYADSITKCMRTELKEDKFKRAVLFVLDEQRMEEVGRDGRPLPVDHELVEEDAVTLHRAVRAEKGGETAMINVVVQRSDTHLREVLRVYSAQYQTNFARDCLKKSGNLVGEMLAHILNGVINKPVRDALLVHHALTTSKRDELRRELLISRLVRFHWDGNHMAAVKAAYRSRYNRDMQEAIRDATGSSDWGLFCRELCITRVPDDVKRVERIEIRHDDRH